MINEQINSALTELLQLNFGYADISKLFSFRNNSNDKVYRFEYSINEEFGDQRVKNFISSIISDHAVRNDWVVLHQHDAIRVEKKIYQR